MSPPPESGRAESALRSAAEAYYWKPSTAWFRALELAEYQEIGTRLPAPVLDLGCGDGRVAWMLERLGLIEPDPIGTDMSRRQLELAGRLDVHRHIVRSDATGLPFRDDRFGSIVCNGVLCSIPDDFQSALGEIRRVLVPGGRAAITVPTDRFQEVLFWPRVLGRVSERLRARYEDAMDARQPHFRALPPDSWRRELEGAGLEVVRVRPFFRRAEGIRWNLLAMHVMRFFGALRLVDGPLVRRAAAPVVAALFRRPFRRAIEAEQHASGDAGYVLLEARKT